MNSQGAVSTPTSDDCEYPLTYGQAALWFLHEADPTSIAYHMAGAVAIPGDTDLEAFRRACLKLTARHPMLRTVFEAPGGRPVQHLVTDLPGLVLRIDASKWSQVELDVHLAEEVDRPMDLEHGPLWRVIVFEHAPIPADKPVSGLVPDHLVLVVCHHIIGDLWSMSILLSEIAALYRAENDGIPAALKPLRSSYAEYVSKEAGRVSGPQGEEAWQYWGQILSGPTPVLDLPIDHPRTSSPSGRGKAHAIHFSETLSNQIRALAEQSHVPLYQVFLAAFQALLYRFTGQEEVLIGFPKAGRSPELARTIGYFINTLVMRADFPDNLRFVDLLSQDTKQFQESARYEWYPFSLLVQRLQPQRIPGQPPLVQALFSWQQAPRLIPREDAGAFSLGLAGGWVDLGGLLMRSLPIPRRAAPFDLTFSAAAMPGGLAATIEYDDDLFEEMTIRRMAGCFTTLLESIIAQPEQLVSHLAILPATEREQVVEKLNASAASYPDQVLLHQLFEQQAERMPEASAVTWEGGQLSYRQLIRSANQLAHYLQGHDVGPGSLVGLYLEPSAYFLIGVLGTLKAGGTYIPLDPAYPPARLSLMLDDAQPAILITRRDLSQRLPPYEGGLLCLDTDEEILRQMPETNPSHPLNPDPMAYVLYTSGSTGKPKGVMVYHRGVVNLLVDFQRRHPISPGEACSWWTSPSFDVSIYEIFSAWLAGGCLRIIPDEVRLDTPVLLEWLHANHIRSAYLPPFVLADFATWEKNTNSLARYTGC